MTALKFILSLALLLPTFAFAQEPPFTALTFQAWKDQQVLEAQNQILRISAKINQLKSGKSAPADSKDTTVTSSRVKKVSDSEQLATSEKDLKRAQDSMETANGLQFADYISIYLPSLQDQPEATAKLLEKMSKDELAEIAKALIKRGTHIPDAKHNVSGMIGESSGSLARTRGI